MARVICAWCRRVLEAHKPGLTGESHGICTDCAERLNEEFDELDDDELDDDELDGDELDDDELDDYDEPRNLSAWDDDDDDDELDGGQ